MHRPDALRLAGRLRRPIGAGIACVIVALAVLSSGCGGSDGDGSSASSQEGSPASRSTAAEKAPERRGSIVFRRWLGPDRTRGAIFTISPDGSGERQISTPSAPESDDFPDYSEDGDLITFQRCADGEPCRIFVVRPDSSGLRRIGECGKDERPPRCADASYPAIAPDGRRIAFVRDSGRVRDAHLEAPAIYTMRLDGSGLRRVTDPNGPDAADDEPQWSPDGRRIVFVRNKLTESLIDTTRAVFVANADGSGLQRVTPWRMNAGDGPVWSPDGDRLLFRSPESEDFLDSNLFTASPDGADLQQVTDVAPTTRLYSSSFSPDGTAITFGMTGTDGEPDVFTMQVDGSEPEPVTRTPLADSAPDWADSEKR